MTFYQERFNSPSTCRRRMHNIPQQTKNLTGNLVANQDYDLTDDGELEDYIGTRFERHKNGSVTLSMPRIIDRVLEIVGLNSTDIRIKLHDISATVIL